MRFRDSMEGEPMTTMEYVVCIAIPVFSFDGEMSSNERILNIY